MKYINVKISDIGEVVGGATPSTKKISNYDGNIPWITPKDLAGYNKIFISKGERNITNEGFKSCSTKMLPPNSILFSSRAPIGYVAISKNELCTNQGFKSIIPNEKIDYIFLYYLLKYNKDYIASKGSGSTFKEISGNVMKKIELSIPKRIQDQKKIAKILFDIDKKIELNNKINNNLLVIIDNLYKNEFTNIQEYKKAEEIANITIGKTPPRGNKECFSKNDKDVKWVSVADLGKCGTYILDTSEKLTKEAVEHYNVKVIPENTIILSFKLTIGRIAITSQEMTTNEAIAHFDLENKDMIYYLYSYLKNFDYENLGSTSSIATAVNSKIIKSMPVAIPEKEVLKSYNKKVSNIFKKIRENELENKALENSRDTLLPKLMNGEINLDNVEI